MNESTRPVEAEPPSRLSASERAYIRHGAAMETRLEGVLGQVECWLSMQWSAGLLETMLRDEVARARAGMAEINAELRSRLAERSESGSSLRGAA